MKNVKILGIFGLLMIGSIMQSLQPPSQQIVVQQRTVVTDITVSVDGGKTFNDVGYGKTNDPWHALFAILSNLGNVLYFYTWQSNDGSTRLYAYYGEQADPNSRSQVSLPNNSVLGYSVPIANNAQSVWRVTTNNVNEGYSVNTDIPTSNTLNIVSFAVEQKW